MIANLPAYDVSLTRGFLPAQDPPARLPPAFEPWEAAAAEMPALLMSGRARARLAALPCLDASGLNGAELERAMQVLSVLGNAYVWATPVADSRLPPPLARPWWKVAARLDRPPIIAHATLVLNNWRRLDPAGSLALDNLDTQLLFLGGLDERWFYLVTVAVEAAGAPGLVALISALEAAATQDEPCLMTHLDALAVSLRAMLDALRRMPEQCDPYIFYHRVRPYLSSWPEPGVIYEGVDETPWLFSGGSAAQSALLQALDAGLGIRHDSPFLRDMRRYMPRGHRRLIADLEASASLRDYLTGRDALPGGVIDAYDGCVELLDQFRRTHLEYSVRYISRQAGQGEARGTGGTDFVPLLSAARKSTRQAAIGRPADSTGKPSEN
jgi:indoleamine 2,3-dioxygenase